MSILMGDHRKTPTSEAARKEDAAGCWWLTSVILATREAEIRRTEVRFEASLGK
jgi:hypothetical protein